MTEWLKILLEHAGYEVRTALIGTRGEELFRLASRRRRHRHDAARRRWHRPGAQVQTARPEVEVIVVTGQGNIPRSVDAVKAGAFDFLEKPIDAERLLDKLEKAIKQKSLVNENKLLKQKLQDRYKFQNVVRRAENAELFDLVESVAATKPTSSSRAKTAPARS